eukprot:m51a1_g13914 hypothetical protein (108) ;mRNA; r:795283-795657
MRNTMTEDEWRQVYEPDDTDERANTFFTLWCLKESYIKALGVGLSHDLERISFTLPNPMYDGPATPTMAVDGKTMPEWSFATPAASASLPHSEPRFETVDVVSLFQH